MFVLIRARMSEFVPSNMPLSAAAQIVVAVPVPEGGATSGSISEMKIVPDL
jgi:hypothetical protein